MNSRKARHSYFLVCLSVLLGYSWSAPAAAATPPNPSGFTATAGAGGDVILKWSPVKGAIYYSLQGPGTPVDSKTGMPSYVTGTTYTVKGLPAGTHSWVLFAVYSGPSGPYRGDESNPARTSMTIAPPAAKIAVLPVAKPQGGTIPQAGASPPVTAPPPVTTAPLASQPAPAVSPPAGTMSPAANIVGQPVPLRPDSVIQREIKFSPQSITLPGPLEMTGMKFHPQSITLPGPLEMTGMKFHPQSITLPGPLEMTGMSTKRVDFEKNNPQMRPSLEKGNLR